jgi:hypothetical protein
MDDTVVAAFGFIPASERHAQILCFDDTFLDARPRRRFAPRSAI